MNDFPKLVRWIYRRWGQMFCFGWAGGFLFMHYVDSPIRGEWPKVAIIAILLSSGLALKWLAFQRWGRDL